MGEMYLSWRDTCEAYDSEWVLIVRPPPAERKEVLGGWVIAHSPLRDDVEHAFDMLPQFQELVVAEASRTKADEVEADIANWDYLLWKYSFVWEETELYDKPHPPSVVCSVKRWWQFWRSDPLAVGARSHIAPAAGVELPPRRWWRFWQ